MAKKTKQGKRLILGLGILIIIIAIVLGFNYFKRPVSTVAADTTPYLDQSGRLVVTTSLFPVYDFAKIVGGDKANVALILPPGAEAHSFKVSPKETEMINKSAIFFYTSALMEPWAPAFKKEVSLKTQVVSTAEGLNDIPQDPHVWLDFNKAKKMVDTIAATYKSVDPANATYYQDNAEAYKKKLTDLDSAYASGLKDCKFQEFVSGGHNTFGYLANRYHLKYQSALGYIPDLNYDTQKIIRLGEELKSTGQPYVYYEEMIMPHFAEILHQESGANLMPLNAAHNVGRYDIESGINFINLMEGNLDILKKGLICK